MVSCHLSFPAGDDILCSVKYFAIHEVALPSKNNLYINLIVLASDSTILGNPSSPFSYPKNCLYGKLTLPSANLLRCPQVTFSEIDLDSSCAKLDIMVINNSPLLSNV